MTLGDFSQRAMKDRQIQRQPVILFIAKDQISIYTISWQWSRGGIDEMKNRSDTHFNYRK
jgi:hypothetical protein